VSVIRWHALSGYSLELTQQTGGRVTIAGGTRALLDAILSAAPFEVCLEAAVAEVTQHGDQVEVLTREGDGYVASAVVVAVPLNALAAVQFTPQLAEVKRRAIELGQASRGIKLMIHARGEPVRQNSIRPGHPFGYLDTEELFADGTQLLIGFGPDAACCDASSLPGVQTSLEAILPGYEVLDARAHDWLTDEFSRGTWAIHRPGWYEHFHRAMQEPEGRVVLAGSDLANGWAGFIDGAIESGLRAGREAAARAGRI
jgi:monoamine oxidase